jgi:hypothetical protein
MIQPASRQYGSHWTLTPVMAEDIPAFFLHWVDETFYGTPSGTQIVAIATIVH